jgi:hypothetical protein
MKLLTATRQGQGERSGDFSYAVEGELVLLGLVCRTDQDDPDGGCGCGRAFSGVSSRRATTTAAVRDLDLSADEFRRAVQDYYTTTGFGPDVLGARESAELVEETVTEALDLARWWPVGTVVGRRLDHIVRR